MSIARVSVVQNVKNRQDINPIKEDAGKRWNIKAAICNTKEMPRSTICCSGKFELKPQEDSQMKYDNFSWVNEVNPEEILAVYPPKESKHLSVNKKLLASNRCESIIESIADENDSSDLSVAQKKLDAIEDEDTRSGVSKCWDLAKKHPLVSAPLTVLFGVGVILSGISAYKSMVQTPVIPNRSRRTVHGEPISTDESKFMVHLNIKVGENYYGCGAAVVGKRSLLTAGHCVIDNAKSVSALCEREGYGTFDLCIKPIIVKPNHIIALSGSNKRSIMSHNPSMHIKISKIEVHPNNIDGGDMQWDFAILTTQKDLPQRTCRLELPNSHNNNELMSLEVDWTPSMMNPNTTIKPTLLSMGWGGDPKDTTDDLRGVALSNIKKTGTSCENYSDYICAGDVSRKGIKSKLGRNLRRDTCSGDSGGPLFHVNQKNGNLIYTGIVSGGSGQCGDEEPGLYADIYREKYWIEKHLNNDEKSLQVCKQNEMYNPFRGDYTTTKPASSTPPCITKGVLNFCPNRVGGIFVENMQDSDVTFKFSDYCTGGIGSDSIWESIYLPPNGKKVLPTNFSMHKFLAEDWASRQLGVTTTTGVPTTTPLAPLGTTLTTTPVATKQANITSLNFSLTTVKIKNDGGPKLNFNKDGGPKLNFNKDVPLIASLAAAGTLALSGGVGAFLYLRKNSENEKGSACDEVNIPLKVSNLNVVEDEESR